jgi:hypothetical protein
MFLVIMRVFVESVLSLRCLSNGGVFLFPVTCVAEICFCCDSVACYGRDTLLVSRLSYVAMLCVAGESRCGSHVF